ncbi:unnamed protein product [Somion occarium]|uniref:Uncharacterized protein n=1 Tax=Somion occarium TaxID=3059160 RepID=A0ABP1DK81_9APHY
MYSNHGPSTSSHVYLNPSIPPVVPVQRNHDTHFHLPPYAVSPGTAMVHGSHQHASWQPHPFIRIPPLVPPPVPHKVWILDCRSCGTFLTNRGMKAVLLLRPNVPLYSTDAMPINCSASAANDPPLLASSSQGNAEDIERFHVNTRTCECLTQTLCCHGCGNSVGYMIVSPCHRCTSSITVTNRTTNGHRFVFYSSEILACERHYVPGEEGVRSPVVSLLPVPAPNQPGSSSHADGFAPSDNLSDMESLTSSPPALFYASNPSSPFRDQGYPYTQTSQRVSQSRMPDLSPVPSQLQSTPAFASAPGVREVPTHRSELSFQPLKTGDVLYWHHLIRSGEMPVVVNDSRARRASLSAKMTELGFKGDMRGIGQERSSSVSRGVFAGR